MGIIAWIVLGALAGWIASMIMKTDAQMGTYANIAVGIVGAFVGGLTVRFLTGDSVDTFSITGLVVAVIGSMILLAIVKVATGGSRATRI